MSFSGNAHWWTPRWLIDMISSYQKIELDPYTVSSNPVGARRFYTEADDAPVLSSWDLLTDDLAFANPPYSREMPKFIDALLCNTPKDAECIVLCRMDNTSWSDDLLDNCSGIVVPKKRINFEKPGTREEVKGVNFSTWLVRVGDPPSRPWTRFAHHFEIACELGTALRR